MENFLICGFSFGGTVSTYLAIASPYWSCSAIRLRFSRALETRCGGFRKKFNPKLLLAQDQQDIRKFSFSSVKLPCVLARSTAGLAWDTVTPRDLRCPTLRMIGTENTHALEAYEEYEKELPYSKVQVRLFEGMTHEQEFENIEQVLPGIMEFFRGEAK